MIQMREKKDPHFMTPQHKTWKNIKEKHKWLR